MSTSVHKGHVEGEVMFYVHPDSEHYYSEDELCCFLEMAEDLGFSLEKDSPLNGLTIGELDRLVHTRM